MDPDPLTKPESEEQNNLVALANVLAVGGTVDWRELYLQAHREPAQRERIRRALRLLDRETSGGTIKLWRTLLNNLEKRERLQQSGESVEEHFQRKEAWKNEPGNRYTAEELQHLWRGKLSFQQQPLPPTMEL